MRSKFEAEIEAASVLTGHERQEEFMRSEAWLDAEHHPLIKFAGTGIEPRPGGFTARGQLTLRGVTREVEIPFDFHGVIRDPWGLRAGLTGEKRGRRALTEAADYRRPRDAGNCRIQKRWTPTARWPCP